MNARPILSKSISSLLFIGTVFAATHFARGATFTWDAGGIGDPTSLGDPMNWTDDTLPIVNIGDTAQWDGTVAGPLALIYNDAAFSGVAGDQGINLSLTATQTGSLNIDSGANTSALRINNVTVATGAGAFSLGNSADTLNITLGGAGGQTHTWTNDSLNGATIASDVVIGLGGGGAHTLVLGGSGNWTFNNAIGQGNGTLTIAKNGTGTLTLTGTSTYTGGLLLNTGTLNINNAGAIGNTATGALTINGGTIDNTSGASITTTTAKAQNWNGDVTFTGTNNLNFNGGVVTIGGSGTNRNVNVNAGTLTEGSIIGSGYSLTKTGSGTLAVGTAISRITGDLNISAGKIRIGAQDFLIGGGLTGGGTIENGGATACWLFVQGNGNSSFSGTIQNGDGAGTLGLSKAGTGTLTLTGTTTYTHQTTINGGTLEFGSSTTAGTVREVSTAANTGLVFDRADGAVKSSSNGTGIANLKFGSRVLRTAGATGNFIISGGTNGTDNSITLVQAAGFINHGLFFNGDNFAWMNATNSFVRGISYGTDTGAMTSGTTASLASATHQEFTGDITAQTSASFTTLKNSGNNALTLASGATVSVNGILKSGNSAGGATISGGTGLQAAASGAEMVIRTNGINDALTISTPILANGASSLTTSGAGTLTLGATNTYTGLTSINSNVILNGSLATGAVNIAPGGTLTLNAGSVINPSNANNGQFNVGSSAGGNAILNINGGTLNAGKNTNPSFVVGGSGNAGSSDNSKANASGFVNMTSGTLKTVHELHIGNGTGSVGANAYAAFTMSGGTVTSGNWLVVGLNNDRALLNQSGGSIAVNANRMTIGAGGNGAIGIINQSGGTLTVAAGGNTGIYLGENGFANYTLSGTGELTLNTNNGGTSGTMQFGGANSSLGANFNLNGGTLTTFGVTKGASTAGAVYRFNFNGGTLRANGNNAAFFADLANTEAYIYGGGATINTNGNAVTVSEPLRAPVGNGLSSIAVAGGGAGYLDQPIVTITGGTGTGATAIANVSGGVVTGFTITNPGSGYSPGDVLNVSLFGGGATMQATVGTITLASNVGGGLTKTGAGTLTLTAANTYTGATTVTGGELRLNSSASIDGSSSVTINGADAKLVQNNLSPLMGPVTLTNGTLDGTGSLNSVTVGDGTGGIIANGDGTGVPLRISTLTFNGAATLNLTVSGATEALMTGALSTGATNAGGKVTINVTNPTGGWNLGVYNLISYSTLTGQGFGGFQKGTVPNLGARQAASLSNSAGFVALTISGDLPLWTGAQNGNWTTDVIGGNSNWKLQSGGTSTDFLPSDTVVFNDTAIGTTNVNISSANVNPTSTTFDNSTLNYTVSSSGGFGIASGAMTKNGTASVSLQTANTYAGGTTLNDGTLNLNHSSAIGTGPLTINGGAIDNTSGAAITLSTNNTQNWVGDFAFGGTNELNLGAGAVSLPSDRRVTTNGTAPLKVGGVISGAGFGITKAGTGELVLAGANNYTGATNVATGTLTLTVTGAINAANAANIGQITVGSDSDNAIMRIAGGTVNATKTGAPSLVVGNTSSAAGALFMEGGTLAATSEIWVGSPAGGFGSMTVNAGSVSSGSWLAVGRNGNGVLNVNGGSVTVPGQNIVLGSFAGANGDANLTAGTTTTANTGANQGAFIVGEGGVGVLTISGSAALNVSGALGVQTARAASGSGFVNLNGGTITTPAITKGPGTTGIFNFNGGTLRPTAANTAFMTGLTAANVFAGGANIDTNGQNITIAQPLIAPVGNGISSIAITNGGEEYVSAPIVRILGGSGTGATAIANISGGVVTSITITNPGTGYAPDDQLFASIEGGGNVPVLAELGTVSLAANNTSGGLNKKGAGTLTLSGVNTYNGPTVVEGGTLAITGSISGSTSINVKAGAIFNVTGVTGGFSLANAQTLKGTGNVTGNVTMSEGSKLAAGDSVGTLAFTGNLDLSLAVTPAATAALAFDLAAPGASDQIAFATGGLSIGTGVLAFNDFAFTTLAGFGNGTYTLFNSNTAIIGTLDSANLSGPLGNGFIGTLGLADNGNDIVLTVVPEPGSAALLLAGFGSMIGLKRFRRREI